MTSSAPHRGVDDEGDPADGDEEDAGTVDLVQQDLVLPSQQDLKPAGGVATFIGIIKHLLLLLLVLLLLFPHLMSAELSGSRG